MLHFLRAALGARRQFEPDRRDRDEGEQRRPVVRIAVGEAFRRQKVAGECRGGEGCGYQDRTGAAREESAWGRLAQQRCVFLVKPRRTARFHSTTGRPVCPSTSTSSGRIV